MPNEINDGGPAFPDDKWQSGMSLRDWFAGQALAGFCAAPRDLRNKTDEDMAKYAYSAADALLARRNKQ